MARTRKPDAAQRRAKEAARRTAAAERIGPRPVPRPRHRSLHDMRPPGDYYEEWGEPGARFLQQGPEEALREIAAKYGEDSEELAIIRVITHYADTYDGQVPTMAATHLDSLVRSSGMAASMAGAMEVEEADAMASVHRLHAQGFLLVRDDGAVCMTVPPGTPHSAPGGRWKTLEEKIPGPARTT